MVRRGAELFYFWGSQKIAPRLEFFVRKPRNPIFEFIKYNKINNISLPGFPDTKVSRIAQYLSTNRNIWKLIFLLLMNQYFSRKMIKINHSHCTNKVLQTNFSNRALIYIYRTAKLSTFTAFTWDMSEKSPWVLPIT